MMSTSYLQNHPHMSPYTSAGRSRSTSPVTASSRNLGRRPQAANNDSERASMAVSRPSSENVVKVFSSLPTVFDFAEYATTRGKVSDESQTFINLIQRVRHDVAEVSRLYETRAITEYLEAWPDKKLWIDTILLDIQRALNDMGTHMEAVRVAGDDGGPASLRRKFEWVLSHQKKFLSKQQYLTTCHQSLMGTVQVLYAAETSYAARDEAEHILRSPHSRHRFRLSLQNNSLPSILVSGVDTNHIEMPASNSPVELPGSTPEDLPDPDSWDLYAPPKRQRSLSASAVPTSPTAMNMPEVTVSAQAKPVQVYIAYNPKFSTLPAKPRITDTREANTYDADKEDERAANAPEVVPITIVAPEVVASPVDDTAPIHQVATLQMDQSCIPPPISPLENSYSPMDPLTSNQDTPTQEFDQKPSRSKITAWPARSSSREPPKVPPARKTFNKIKPLPLYTRSRSSDAVSRPRALSESLKHLEDKARASFDSKPRPMPTVEEKQNEVYSTAASVRLSAVSLLPTESMGPRVKEVTVKKAPLRSQTMPMELPDLSSTGSLMEELSHWVLPPGARTSYHSLDTNGSLDASTPATSTGGSPVTNNSRDTKDIELVVNTSGATPAEALKSPPSVFKLFPSTPTTPGLPARAPPPLPKDLLPRIEKPKTAAPEKPVSTRQNETTPMSPEGAAPPLPPRPRLEVTQPSNEEVEKTNLPASEEPAPPLPPRPDAQRSLSPSGPPIPQESPLPSPQGPLPALPPRRPSPQASSSSLSADESNTTKNLKRGTKPRKNTRSNVRVRSPSLNIPNDQSSTPQSQHRAPSPAEKALPIPPELRSLSEQLKQSEPTPVTPTEASKFPRAKVDVTMEAHPGTLVKVVPSFPQSPPLEPGSPPPTSSAKMMELPPIEISHSHPEVVPVACDGAKAREAETKCESKVTAQTKRRRAHARRMAAAAADD